MSRRRFSSGGGQSSLGYMFGGEDGQNTGNFIKDRPSIKVHASPGGGSTLGYLFGGNETSTKTMDVLCTDYETKLSVQNKSTSPYESTVRYDCSRTPTSPPASWAHHRYTLEDGAVNTFPQTTTCAEEALKYYNKKHGTEYKLVKPINSGVVLYDRVWLHANFTASESSNSSPKLFFAELMFIGIENSIELYWVTGCCPLDDVEVTTNCEMCEVEMSHPATGFLRDLPESSEP